MMLPDIDAVHRLCRASYSIYAYFIPSHTWRLRADGAYPPPAHVEALCSLHSLISSSHYFGLTIDRLGCLLLSWSQDISPFLGYPEHAVIFCQGDEAPYLVSIIEGIYFSVDEGESDVGSGQASVNILVKRGASAAPTSTRTSSGTAGPIILVTRATKQPKAPGDKLPRSNHYGVCQGLTAPKCSSQRGFRNGRRAPRSSTFQPRKVRSRSPREIRRLVSWTLTFVTLATPSIIPFSIQGCPSAKVALIQEMPRGGRLKVGIHHARFRSD